MTAETHMDIELALTDLHTIDAILASNAEKRRTPIVFDFTSTGYHQPIAYQFMRWMCWRKTRLAIPAVPKISNVHINVYLQLGLLRLGYWGFSWFEVQQQSTCPSQRKL